MLHYLRLWTVNHQHDRIRCSNSGAYEELIESQPTFLRNMSPPSSDSKNKLSKKPA
jgi:hypothetical protein